MYAASSNSSTASSTASSTGSATTSDHRAQPLTDRHNYGTQKTSVQSSNRQRSHKSTRSQHTTSGSSNPGHHQSAPTLQSLVRTKCWSIAPLWKFVTYELETQPAQVLFFSKHFWVPNFLSIFMKQWCQKRSFLHNHSDLELVFSFRNCRSENNLFVKSRTSNLQNVHSTFVKSDRKPIQWKF